ncbi:hypothetical protein [Hymenobacter sp. 5414T-23]|uniref:hypothetical protein n=1 Tax=Hymenobacter sp. 5414T-23 TaxID=2932252 RepID=UPI001FD16AA7|nr:hypothetical protein [Hymenobacter sp. 5414T-23]UOQ79522.1 hypothetical protein MUN83_11725 [Hymenobacter sp. 5414T-23]
MDDVIYLFRGVSISGDKLIGVLESKEYDESDVSALLYVLRKTVDNRLINTICLAFAGLKYNESIPDMMRLLSSEMTRNKKGTILYSMKALKYEKYLPDIFRMLNDDFSFEAFNMIYLMIDECSATKNNKMYLREVLINIESRNLRSVFIHQIRREIKLKLSSPISFPIKKVSRAKRN